MLATATVNVQQHPHIGPTKSNDARVGTTNAISAMDGRGAQEVKKMVERRSYQTKYNRFVQCHKLTERLTGKDTDKDKRQKATGCRDPTKV